MKMRDMMFVCAILNAKKATRELPSFAGDIAAIFVDESMTTCYTIETSTSVYYLYLSLLLCIHCCCTIVMY